MYVKMHSQSSPFVNTGTLPVVHNSHQKHLIIYPAFFAAFHQNNLHKPGQITPHPYAIEMLLERRT